VATGERSGAAGPAGRVRCARRSPSAGKPGHASDLGARTVRVVRLAGAQTYCDAAAMGGLSVA